MIGVCKTYGGRTRYQSESAPAENFLSPSKKASGLLNCELLYTLRGPTAILPILRNTCSNRYVPPRVHETGSMERGGGDKGEKGDVAKKKGKNSRRLWLSENPSWKSLPANFDAAGGAGKLFTISGSTKCYPRYSLLEFF